MKKMIRKRTKKNGFSTKRVACNYIFEIKAKNYMNVNVLYKNTTLYDYFFQIRTVKKN